MVADNRPGTGPEDKGDAGPIEHEAAALAVADQQDAPEAPYTEEEYAQGYARRTLNDGSADFLCLFDHWTARDERIMQEHVANVRARAANYQG